MFGSEYCESVVLARLWVKRNLWTVVGCAAKVNLRPPWSPSALALFIESAVRGFSLETFVRRNQKVASEERSWRDPSAHNVEQSPLAQGTHFPGFLITESHTLVYRRQLLQKGLMFDPMSTNYCQR